MRIFLSGAIEDVVGDFPVSWRHHARDELTEYDIVMPQDDDFEKDRVRSPKEIVRRNILLQKDCDLLLVEYTIPNRCYVGTDFELTMALQWSQPAIVWAHEMYCKRVYLRYLAAVILPSLEECLDYIRAYYPSRRDN